MVGITGTNGKSTVTTLVARMAERAGLAARAGGNLSPPALDLLEGGPGGVYVLELSSYQLETTQSLRLAAATVLNVTPTTWIATPAWRRTPQPRRASSIVVQSR